MIRAVVGQYITPQTIRENQMSEISVFPNPAGNFFTVSMPQIEQPAIKVFNAVGRLVYTSREITSLDHIIPMSKGGPHVKSNVALAHFICNSIKSDGAVGEQLLLVG